MTPIIGISEVRRFSRGGKIRLGEKRKGKNKEGKEYEYPAKLDYFLFDPDDERHMPELVEKFGPKPRQLLVAFPSEDLEITFPQYYHLYTAAGLLCKGNGATAMRSAKDGVLVECECPMPEHCPYSLEKGKNGKPGCKRLARLSFFLVEFDHMFIWQISTTSWNSMVNVNSGLDLLRNVAGRISFVPITLALKEARVNPDGTTPKIAWVLDLVVPVGLRHIKALRPLIGNDVVAQLPAPDESCPDDLYPASQITDEGEEVIVDADGVVQEPEPTPPPAPIRQRTRVAQKAEPVPAPPAPPEPESESFELDPPSKGSSVMDDAEKAPGLPIDYSNLEQVQRLMKIRPVVTKAILGQARGENWPVERVIQVIEQRLQREES